MNERKGNIVKLTLDPNNPPPLTAQERAQLEKIAAMPDADIDYSDAPHRPEAIWIKVAARLPEPKKQVTLRVDAEVLDFFKRTGKRYHTRMNAVLRSYVEASKAHAGM